MHTAVHPDASGTAIARGELRWGTRGVCFLLNESQIGSDVKGRETGISGCHPCVCKVALALRWEPRFCYCFTFEVFMIPWALL